MEDGSLEAQLLEGMRIGSAREKVAHPSTDKALRTMLLAVLLQVSWPLRFTGREITEQLPLYGENPRRALYRDIATLTDCQVENLPEPMAETPGDHL